MCFEDTKELPKKIQNFRYYESAFVKTNIRPFEIWFNFQDDYKDYALVQLGPHNLHLV